MKRRTFFRSLAAVAAIAFAEPLALLKPKPKWVMETKFEQFYVDAEPVYDKAIVKGYLIAEFKQAIAPNYSEFQTVVFHRTNE